MLFPKSMLDHVCVVSRCILKRLKPNTDLVRKTFAAKETLIGRAADIVLVAVGKKLEPRNLVPTFFWPKFGIILKIWFLEKTPNER